MYSESKQALADQLELKRPAVLAVSGVHGSGKTTLLEKLLPILRGRGLKEGVITHDGGDNAPDAPGTDGRRLREAGAPVLTKPADVPALGPAAEELFTLESRCTDLYVLARPDLTQAAPGQDYRSTPFMV